MLCKERKKYKPGTFWGGQFHCRDLTSRCGFLPDIASERKYVTFDDYASLP